MINLDDGIPDVAPDELLARYILQSSHIRSSDQTVKPDAFIPHPYPDLSVTRHLATTEEELWNVGQDVATETRKTLYGRADLHAPVCLAQQLCIVADALPNNPNHANIRGWPTNKPAQKIIALEIAVAAVFVARE